MIYAQWALLIILTLTCVRLHRRINLLERDVTYLVTGEIEVKR